MGFTSWLIDAEVPAYLAEWVRSGISSRIGFLLALNVFLLVVGFALMAGATGAVKAIKMSAKLVSGRQLPDE